VAAEGTSRTCGREVGTPAEKRTCVARGREGRSGSIANIPSGYIVLPIQLATWAGEGERADRLIEEGLRGAPPELERSLLWNR
jgi:hypothetical protein